LTEVLNIFLFQINPVCFRVGFSVNHSIFPSLFQVIVIRHRQLI
jgi:hypothetical protein